MKILKVLLFTLFIAFLPKTVSAHCEIPCGIYNDSLRIALLYEHVQTIEKSMNSIIEIDGKSSSANQLVRWVMNKEDHANKMQDIISKYFMHQRIKPKGVGEVGRKEYIAQLEAMHRLSILAMKSKQSVDLELIDAMQKTIHDFEHAYFKEHVH